jgi:hypothetical protein
MAGFAVSVNGRFSDVRRGFDAINDVRGWWSEEIDGSTDKLGDEFKFHSKDLHRSTQKITEWVADRKVVWQVVDSHRDCL